MKLLPPKWVAAVLLVFLALGCRPDSLLPAPEPSAPEPALSLLRGEPLNQTSSTISSEVGRLADMAGQTEIQYCGIIPCQGPQPDWGVVNLSDGTGVIRAETTLGFGWFISRVDHYGGDQANINIVNGIPTPDPGWTNLVPSPAVNSFAVDLPYPQSTGCFTYCIRFEIMMVDFFSGVDPNSIRYVYLYNPDWNNPNTPEQNTANAFVSAWCLRNRGGQ